MPTVQEIGDIWAGKIETAFLAWAAAERLSKRLRINLFDPTTLIKNAFFEAAESSLSDIGIGVKYNLTSKEAIAWCEKYGAQQIKEINAGTRAAIREITRRGLEDGLSPAEQQKAIKQIIGLNQRQLAALENFKTALGDSANDKLIQKEINRLLNVRAKTIGLTESHTATNNGQLQAFDDATKKGIIKKSEYMMEWLYTADKRTCDRCRAYHGTHADIGESFPNGMRCPPAHPRCRCTVVLVKK